MSLLFVLLLVAAGTGAFGSYMMLVLDGMSSMLLVTFGLSLLLGYYAFSSLIKLNNKCLDAMKDEIRHDSNPLVHWIYDDKKYFLYTKNYYLSKFKSRFLLLMISVGIPILLVFTLVFFDDAKLASVLVFPLILIVIMVLMGFKESLLVLKKAFFRDERLDIHITKSGFMVNNSLIIPLNTLSTLLSEIQIVDCAGHRCLNIHLKTVGDAMLTANDEFSIPIPLGREREADQLKEQLDEYHHL